MCIWLASIHIFHARRHKAQDYDAMDYVYSLAALFLDGVLEGFAIYTLLG